MWNKKHLCVPCDWCRSHISTAKVKKWKTTRDGREKADRTETFYEYVYVKWDWRDRVFGPSISDTSYLCFRLKQTNYKYMYWHTHSDTQTHTSNASASKSVFIKCNNNSRHTRKSKWIRVAIWNIRAQTHTLNEMAKKLKWDDGSSWIFCYACNNQSFKFFVGWRLPLVIVVVVICIASSCSFGCLFGLAQWRLLTWKWFGCVRAIAQY